MVKAEEFDDDKFIAGLVKQLDDDTNIAADCAHSSEFTGYMDTGSYSLNALLSGSIYGGTPNNKTLAFAGETTTGKTFFVLGIAKNFLDANPTGWVLYFDTESAVTTAMLMERGIDVKRFIISEPETVQQWKTKALKFLESYMAAPEDKRMPFLMILDSLGNLSTTKELEDSMAGSEKKDMTRPGAIRAAFRTVRLKMAKAKVPMLITNHTYAAIGTMYPTQEISGGGGMKYASDTIALLSKRQDKDGNETIGSVIHIMLWKSRLTREKQRVDVLLNHRTGLDRYYGLLEIAEKHDVVKKVHVGKVDKYEFPDGRRVFASAVRAEPEKFYTQEVLCAIDNACTKQFKYGQEDDRPVTATEETEEEAA